MKKIIPFRTNRMDDFFYHCIIMPEEIYTRKSSGNTIATGTMKIVLSLLLFAACSLVSAQLSSPDKVSAFKADYPSNPGTDSVFIFNRPVYKGILTISLQATSVDSTTGWGFLWSVYNENTRSYDLVPKADAGMSSAIDTISVSSGYRVIMTKGSKSDTFRVWILFNDFDVTVTNKDESGTVLSGDRSCKSVTLSANTVFFPLEYPEPGTDNHYNTVDVYHYRWKSDSELSDDPSGNSYIGRVHNPPFRDTWYTVTVTDNFQLSRSDSVFCPAIASKASMTVEHVKLFDATEYPGTHYEYYYDDVKSAPGKFRFDISGSENSVVYKIDFGDSLYYETDADSGKIVHEYELPKKYTAILMTRSPGPLSCPDSIVVENIVELDADTTFVLPNVFTPNGDFHNDIALLFGDENNKTINNVFRSTDVSVFYIDITIFDRIGNKVHQYSGNIRDWIGWDGNVMESNREAPDGVYFYCITRYFYGTDKKNPKLHRMEKTSKGFIHLYREN